MFTRREQFAKLTRAGRTLMDEELYCDDILDDGCDFVARGETLHEVLDKMWKHVLEAHPDQIGKILEDKSKREVSYAWQEKIREFSRNIGG